MLQHNLKELHDDLGGRPAHDLAEATLLSVADALKSIVENTNAHHCCEGEGGGTRSARSEAGEARKAARVSQKADRAQMEQQQEQISRDGKHSSS